MKIVLEEKKMKRDTARLARGFTLMELLLVMIILTILAALVVPNFVGRSKKAQITAAKTDISNIGLALDLFEQECGRYPSSQEGLAALRTSPGDPKWAGPYLKTDVPLDPWGHAYVYRSPGQQNKDSYDLYSCGPSGQDGGADNIGNWTSAQ